MNCKQCIKVNPIPTCADEWVIPFVPDNYNGQELMVRITNTATGAVYTTTSEEVVNNEVSILVPEELSNLMDHYYKIELIMEGELNPITMMVEDSQGCCLEFTTFPFTSDVVTFSLNNCEAI
jgi:hypothetical protein